MFCWFRHAFQMHPFFKFLMAEVFSFLGGGQYWDLNSELLTCYEGYLLFEPCFQTLFGLAVFQIGSHIFAQAVWDCSLLCIWN
jgi:hypothetical protein